MKKILLFAFLIPLTALAQPPVPSSVRPVPQGDTSATVEVLRDYMRTAFSVWRWDSDRATSYVLTRLNASGLSDANKAKYSQAVVRAYSRPDQLWAQMPTVALRRVVIQAAADSLATEADRLQQQRLLLLQWRQALLDNATTCATVVQDASGL